MSTPSPEQMSCLGWMRSEDAAQSWPISRRRKPFKLSEGCTTWAPARWSFSVEVAPNDPRPCPVTCAFRGIRAPYRGSRRHGEGRAIRALAVINPIGFFYDGGVPRGAAYNWIDPRGGALGRDGRIDCERVAITPEREAAGQGN